MDYKIVYTREVAENGTIGFCYYQNGCADKTHKFWVSGWLYNSHHVWVSYYAISFRIGTLKKIHTTQRLYFQGTQDPQEIAEMNFKKSLLYIARRVAEGFIVDTAKQEASYLTKEEEQDAKED